MRLCKKHPLSKAPAAAYNALFSAPMCRYYPTRDRAAYAICSSLLIRQVGKQVADQTGAWYGSGMDKQITDHRPDIKQ